MTPSAHTLPLDLDRHTAGSRSSRPAGSLPGDAMPVRSRGRTTRVQRGARLVALVAAMALAGCASMAPDYQRPAAPVEATFPGAERATAVESAAAAADISWHAFFSDPRLKHLIGIALENNRDLRATGLAIEQARAQYGIQRADEWPTINAIASGVRQPGLIALDQPASLLQTGK